MFASMTAIKAIFVNPLAGFSRCAMKQLPCDDGAGNHSVNDLSLLGLKLLVQCGILNAF